MCGSCCWLLNSEIGLIIQIVFVQLVFVMFVVLPAPFLSSIASNLFYQPEPSIWDGYLLRPVLPAADYNPIAPPVWSVIFLITAAFLHVQAEANRRRRPTHTPPQELQHA